jgi:hypothetical protein
LIVDSIDSPNGGINGQKCLKSQMAVNGVSYGGGDKYNIITITTHLRLENKLIIWEMFKKRGSQSSDRKTY